MYLSFCFSTLSPSQGGFFRPGDSVLKHLTPRKKLEVLTFLDGRDPTIPGTPPPSLPEKFMATPTKSPGVPGDDYGNFDLLPASQMSTDYGLPFETDVEPVER